MKRLRHPIRAIREPFGTAGVVIGVVALVLALVTGAYAAGGGFSGKQKKEIKKIAKQEAQKYANSNPGAPGQPGAPGKDGANGKNGSDGAPGTDGISAETTSFTGKKTVGTVKCEEGGVVVKSATPETAVCNGAKGKQGEPWVAGGTLPEKQTETGVWGTASASSPQTFPISFAIPLKSEPETVIVGPNEEQKPGCPGRGGGEFGPGKPAIRPTVPMAEPGKLCIYVLAQSAMQVASPPAGGAPVVRWEYEPIFEEWEMVPGASPTGGLLYATSTGTGWISGVWAVTAPEE